MKRLVSLLAIVALLLTGCAGVGGFTSPSDVQKLTQGMTEKEVVAQIGRPMDINRSEYGSFSTAQFVYERPGITYERIYLYFRNHRLESIQY